MAGLQQEQLREVQRLTEQAGNLWNEERYPETEALCVKALELARAAVGDNSVLIAESHYNLAGLYYFQRRFAEAIQHYRDAILIYERHQVTHSLSLAFSYAWLGRTLFGAWQEDPDFGGARSDQAFVDAEACFLRASALMRQAAAAETAEYAACLMHLGHLYFYQGQHGQAEPLLVESLELRERLLGPDHLEAAECAGRLALLYSSWPDSHVDAEPYFLRALALREEHLEPLHAEVLEWIYRTGKFYHVNGKAEEAAQQFARLGEMLPSADECEELGPIREGYIWYLEEVGSGDVASRLRSAWKREEGYLTELRRDLQRAEKMLGPDHARVGDCLTALAAALSCDEQYAEAEMLYKRALNIHERAFGAKSTDLVEILNGLALLYRQQDRLAEAEAVLERALTIPYARNVAVSCRAHAWGLEQLGWIRAAQQREKEAARLFERAVALMESAPSHDLRALAELRYRMSMFYANAGRYQEARKTAVAALNLAEQTSEVEEMEKADYREQYAFSLLGLGRRDEAEEQFALVKKIRQDSGYPWDNR